MKYYSFEFVSLQEAEKGYHIFVSAYLPSVSFGWFSWCLYDRIQSSEFKNVYCKTFIYN